jgi:hypothetical protein
MSELGNIFEGKTQKGDSLPRGNFSAPSQQQTSVRSFVELHIAGDLKLFSTNAERRKESRGEGKEGRSSPRALALESASAF